MPFKLGGSPFGTGSGSKLPTRSSAETPTLRSLPPSKIPRAQARMSFLSPKEVWTSDNRAPSLIQVGTRLTGLLMADAKVSVA
jgi:hypothetical protein